jgi:hypothetical protein
VWGSGVKLALPHLGRWHEIETHSIEEAEADEGSTVGQIWKAGGETEPDDTDPNSSEPRDYWHEQNRFWGEPGSSPAGVVGGKDGIPTKWVMEGTGRTRFLIRRLTDAGMELTTDETEFKKLVEFIRHIYGKIAMASKDLFETEIKLLHPSNYEGVVISTEPKNGELSFVDFTDEKWYSDHILPYNNFMPVKFTGTLTAGHGSLRYTIITGILRKFKTKFPDGQQLNFLDYTSDPYPGLYMWGNGRFFERAHRPKISWTPTSKMLELPDEGSLSNFSVNFSKNMTGNVVGLISFEGDPRDIPWDGPVKWSFTKTKWAHEKAVLNDFAKLAKPLLTIENLLYSLGVHQSLGEVLVIDNSDLGSAPKAKGGDGDD